MIQRLLIILSEWIASLKKKFLPPTGAVVNVQFTCSDCGSKGWVSVERVFVVGDKLHPMIKAYCGSEDCAQSSTLLKMIEGIDNQY